MVRSEPIKLAVAKFYAAVFLFYADAIEWYKSGSRTKIRHSLHEGFSDRFKDQLQDIKRLSRLVNRAATSGHGAETSFVRLQLEQLKQDVRVGLQGRERLVAEENHQRQIQAVEVSEAQNRKQLLQISQADLRVELWRMIGLSGTMVLQDETQGFIEKRDAIRMGSQTHSPGEFVFSSTQASPVPKSPPITDRTAVLNLSVQLCSFIDRGAPIIDLKPLPYMLADQRIVKSLEGWLLSPESRILCLEGPYAAPNRSETSLGAAHITWTAVGMKVPSISFFCEAESDTNHLTDAGIIKTQGGFLGLIYSLIHQIVCLWPPVMDNIDYLNSNRFTSLNASESDSWTPALDLFRDLLKTAPPLILCVIDSLQVFDEESSPQTAQLIGILRSAMEDKMKVLKVLITTSGYAPNLLPNLNEEEFERLNIAQTTNRVGPGKMPLWHIDDKLS